MKMILESCIIVPREDLCGDFQLQVIMQSEYGKGGYTLLYTTCMSL